jgi:phospholipase C
MGAAGSLGASELLKDPSFDAGCRDAATVIAPEKRIQHIIVLMLENRSFDHMLGFAKIEGTRGVWDNPQTNTYYAEGRPIVVSTSNKARTAGDYTVDPDHDLEAVNRQLFDPGGPESGPPQIQDPPQMQGFAKSYAKYIERGAVPEHVMKCFDPKNVPVLTNLAREFAVCDSWFASIPGPTLPNRLYAHTGRSKGGRVDMSPLDFDSGLSIYELLARQGVSSTIYSDGWSATHTFWELMKYQHQFFGTMDDFYQDCYDNHLPAYSFIEPRYSSSIVDGTFRPQNDQHPDSDVTEGEHLIYDIYQAIRGNPKVWKSSMFVIVYDEHGGIFDHVPPPSAIPPDDVASADPPFKFDRLGVRVPAVIVSAYTNPVVLNKETDVFDHTSLIATARKLLTGTYRDNCLGLRARNANTFDNALNLTTPRDPVDLERPQVPARLQKSPSQRSKHDQECLECELNHLQIMNLKQALLVNSALPDSMKLKPKSILKKDVINTSPDEAFRGITVRQADHYTRSVQTSLSHSKGVISKSAAAERAK